MYFLGAYSQARSLTNFQHFLTRATVEMDPKTITARKLLYQAEQLRLGAEAAREQALAKYEDARALRAWREVLEKYPDYRADTFIQEQTFDTELKYLRL